MKLQSPFRPLPKQPRQRRLLVVWRKPSLKWLLVLFLFRLANRSRSSAAIAAAENSARMVCRLARQRQRRRTWQKTAPGRMLLTLQSARRRCRRRCRVHRHRLQVRLLRFPALQTLCLALWLLWLGLPLVFRCLSLGAKNSLNVRQSS